MFFFFNRRVYEVIFYMEEVVVNLRLSFGVGYYFFVFVLNYLVVVYVELKNLIKVVEFFEEVKSIYIKIYGFG